MAEELPTIGRRVSTRSNKYSIGNLSYPENVAASDDTQHYVMFYINVRESSQFNKETRIGFVNNAGQNRTDQTRDVEALGVKSSTARDAAYGTSVGLGAYMVANKLQGSSLLSTGVAGAALLGANKAGAGTETKNIFHVEKTQRISDVITLAIQNRPSTTYGVDWQQQELGTMMGVLSGSSSIESSTAASAGLASDLTRRLMETAATLPGALNTNNRVQNMMESGTKRVANPFREVLFKSVGFRKFQFVYRFMPKSANESKNVKDIIETFKFHMHPEMVASGLYYIYPSEFDIVYYFKGEENKWLNKISTCALTDMTVDYGGSSGQYSTFADGAATEINLTLTFNELETLTKERIKEGY